MVQVNGRIALSTKTLEPEPGDMIKNPQKVYDMAEVRREQLVVHGLVHISWRKPLALHEYQLFALPQRRLWKWAEVVQQESLTHESSGKVKRRRYEQSKRCDIDCIADAAPAAQISVRDVFPILTFPPPGRVDS